ncbi:unnamed protein product [Mytilus coruscus]|uniref:Ig-like domain-containing protein n=1 Tax=Mytilus coruscus TaxID=42192 RepID=A0A6J8A734_MYTCO|nr:unnamed protein product [Mytilus coruscus]
MLAKIKVLPEKTTYTVGHGENITLKCTIKDGSKWLIPFVNWVKTSKRNSDGIEEFKETRREWNYADKTYSTFLTITSASNSETFNCSVLNRISADIELKVLRINPAKSKYEVTYKDPCKLECTLEEFPLYFDKSVKWERRQKKSQAITEIEGNVEEDSVSKTYLTITSAEEIDSGFYRCRVRHQDQELRSDEIELCIYGILADNPEYEIDSGYKVELKWRWIDRPFSSSLRFLAHGNYLASYDQHKWKLSTPEGRDPTIVIAKTDLRHDGYYSCKARYSFDGSRRRTQISDIHLNVREKDNVRYMWSDDGAFLHILNANKNDSGIYSCAATVVHTNKREISSDIKLLVSEKEPVSIRLDPDYAVSFGGNITLKCTLTGEPYPVSLYWTKDGQNLSITCNNKYVGGTLESPSLTIVNVDGQDDGTYTCYTQNDDMHCNASTKLSVKCEKLSLMVTNTLYTVLLHDSVTFECSLSGNPPSNAVCWMKVKDDEEVIIRQHMNKQKNKPKYCLTNTTNPSLTINNVDDDDAGVYKCKAENNDSESQSEDIYLCVFGGNVSDISKYSHFENYIVHCVLFCNNGNYFPSICIDT